MKKRFQFGLGAMLLLIAAISVPLASFRRGLADRAEQAAALREERGVSFTYTTGRRSTYGRFESLPIDQIVRVSLHGKHLGDDDVPKFVGLDSLAQVFISETSITDSGIQQLANLPALRRLSIRNSPVTRAGAEQFKRERPDVQVFLHTAADGPSVILMTHPAEFDPPE
jgi:hypothetical protein